MTIVDRSLSEGKVKGRVNWPERNRYVLQNVAPSLEHLQEKYEEDKTSLGLIKPKEVLDFYKRGELQIYEDNKEFQQALFGTKMPVIEEIPHIFGYSFKCDGCSGGGHNIQCEDWELLESYRSWGRRYRDVDVLWDKLYQKYFTEMLEKDLYFFMGMFSQYPTWLIIGLYYPPKGV